MPLVPILAASACVFSVVALYAGSPHCRWPALRRAGAGAGTATGLLAAIAGLVLWCVELGIGAGLCVALLWWMLPAMLLPWLALRAGAGQERG